MIANLKTKGEAKRFFIPPWLDDLDLKPNAFRVYCHLLRRAGDDGKCFTGGKAISTSCRISKDTVWPTLTLLEEKGLIRRIGKKFGASNNFLVMHSIGGNGGLNDSDAIGGNEGSIDSCQSAESEGFQSAEKEGCQSAEMKGQEEIPIKKSTLKKSNKSVSYEPSSDAIRLSTLFKSSLPTDYDIAPNWKTSWPKTFDQLIAKGRNLDEIEKIIRWLKAESNWWNPKFMEPTKLAKRDTNKVIWYDRLKAEMTSAKSSASPARHSPPDTTNRPGTYEEA
jgi:hypothetical protein